MKKFFLIPVLALFTCVSAWGTVHTAGTIDELTSALAAAVDGDEIQLTADINYGYPSTAGVINITKSITLNGQGHTLTGASSRPDGQTSQWATIWVNPSSMVDATIKNITIVNAYSNTGMYVYAIQTRKNINSLTIEDAVLDIRNGGRGNSAPFQMGGSDTNLANITINNCEFFCKNSDYPFLTWVPANIVANGSKFHGYCSMYFKFGSEGSVLTADACDFDAPNVHSYSGGWNNFGVFVTEDSNITINLHNCGMNSEETGFAKQGMILAEMPGCIVNISGDNSHINGKMVLADDDDPGYWLAFLMLTGGNVSITGGTYSVNPSHYGPYNPFTSFGDQEPTLPDEDLYENFVPDGYEVQEVKQGDVTLYRVVKKAQEKTPGVMYDLNDFVPVEGVDEGNNPISSFDLSTGTGMTLNNEVTTAGYVQISDNEDTGDATIVTVGQTAGGDDQTLVINNGLDVQGESQVVVEPGATLQIGEGGINTEKPENIIIEADENGAASLLLDPTITVNQTPNLTVRMTAKQIGRNAQGDFYWHRFAMPVNATITSWDKEGTLVAADPEYTVQYPTYIYGWNYAENKWKNLSGVSAMVPLQGYTLTLASDYIHVDGAGKVVSEGTNGGNLNALQDVVYTFKGELVGNTPQPLNFQAEGFNFFGNSYTGYMDVLKLIEGIQSNNVEGTVYMWCNDPDDEDGNYQSYVGVPLYKLSTAAQRARLADWQKEVAPMQTFILRLRGADSAEENVNYASAIWGNPRYGNTTTSTPAPRRRVAAINEDTYMEIAVKAANGKGSRVDFTESANNSDEFESGYDVVKYMNEKSINLYATINGEDFSSVVTDNIEGKTLTLKTNGEINYTMTFKNVEGNEYAIRDNATNRVIAIEEGATYAFAAQPNSTIEGRFEIVSRAQMPTAIENTEVNANAKGIYTIMGQYMGEDFSILPAGVYVVNGVKIVK